MNITTDISIVQDAKDVLDVDCDVCFDGNWNGKQWKMRVSLAKDTNQIHVDGPILYAAKGDSPYIEITKDQVPSTVMEVLEETIKRAKDKILIPRMKDPMTGWTTNDIKRILVNPIFTGLLPYAPIVEKEVWVKTGVRLIGEMGAENYLRLLLEELEKSLNNAKE